MRRLLMCLLFTTTVYAQDPPPPMEHGIKNTVVVWGYDKTLTMPGDLNALFGKTGEDNAIRFTFPTRNVVFEPEHNTWTMDVGQHTGTRYVWVYYSAGIEDIGYYPADMSHGWLPGFDAATPEEIAKRVKVLGDGYLDCKGYDGNLEVAGDMALKVPGDLKTGYHNGYRFRRPVRGAHIIDGKVIHGELNILNSKATPPVFEWFPIVYPRSMCDFIKP